MLGEQVRKIRKKRGITLKELAEKTGLSIGYISQIERNLTDPSLSTLRKLSAALDIPTYLFMGGRKQHRSDHPSGGRDDPLSAQLQYTVSSAYAHAQRGFCTPVVGHTL